MRNNKYLSINLKILLRGAIKLPLAFSVKNLQQTVDIVIKAVYLFMI